MARDGGLRERREAAAQRRRNILALHREAAHMELVDDCLAPRRRWPAILPPSVGRIDHCAFGDAARVVAPVEAQIRLLAADAIAMMRVAPSQPADQGLGV